MSATATLPTLESIETALGGLAYKRRCEYASKLGKQFADHEDLPQLVAALLDHPAADVPESELEDGFTELLPPQQTTVSSHFHLDQCAMWIISGAGALKFHDVLTMQVKSPSQMVKKLAIKLLVPVATDTHLFHLLKSSVKHTRSLLLENLTVTRRVALFDQYVDHLQTVRDGGVPLAASILHCCSSEVVKKYLDAYRNHAEGVVSSRLSWPKLAHYHPTVLLEMIEADVSSVDIFDRTAQWSRWMKPKMLKVFVTQTSSFTQLWKLMLKYAIHTRVSSTGSFESLKPYQYATTLPSMFFAFPKFFVKHFPDDYLTFLLNSLSIHPTTHYVRQFETPMNIQYLSFDRWLIFLKAYVKLITKAVNSGLPSSLHLLSPSLVSKYNVYAALRIFDVLQTFLKETRTFCEKESASWKKNWREQYTGLITTTISFAKSDSNRKLGECRKKKKQYEYPLQTQLFLKASSARGDLHFTSLKITTDAYTTVYTADLAADLNLLPVLVQIGKMMEGQITMMKTADGRNKYFEINGIKALYRNEKGTAWKWLSTIQTQIQHYARVQKDEAQQQEMRDQATTAASALVDSALEILLNVGMLDDSRVVSFVSGTLLRQEEEKTFTTLLPTLAGIFRGNTGLILALLTHLKTPSRRITLLELATEDDWLHIAQKYFHRYLELFHYFSEDQKAHALTVLLEEGVLSEANREQLLPYQDISVPAIRKSFHKGTDSNNDAERIAFLNLLVKCTTYAASEVQTTRTLKFLAAKIKNEIQERRAAVLLMLRDTGRGALFPEGAGHEYRELWFSMLEDALESPDLDENTTISSVKLGFAQHPVLQHFFSLSQQALAAAFERHDKDLFEFGVEMQWRLYSYRCGARQCALVFRIAIPSDWYSLLHRVEKVKGRTETAVFAYDGIISHYTRLISEKQPEFLENVEYVQPVVGVLSQDRWSLVPGIVTLCQTYLQKLREESDTDSDGVYILESSHPYVTFLQSLLSRHREEGEWLKYPVLVEYVELLLHSRLAPLIVYSWLKDTNPKDLESVRASQIEKLLAISPSAIHLRFVHRWLFNHRQHLLNDYINQKKSFRGVFFVEPEKRVFNKEKLTLKSSKAPRIPTPTMGATSLGSGSTTSAEAVKLEAEAEADFLKDLSEGAVDHPDMFIFDACYGLHCLLPSQLEGLSAQWSAQVMSLERSMPLRSRALARWTVMPNVTYADMVSFLNENENEREVDGKKVKGMSAKLQETLLRGVLINDEPVAGLSYLFTDKFLASDLCRVAIYSISQAVKYLPAGGLTRMVKFLLTGKRRHILNISAFKEVIRLLASTPSDKHLRMILHEWSREEVHRDVRITILLEAMKMLQLEGDLPQEICWAILESGPKLASPEVLAALLGCIPSGGSAVTYENLFRNERMLDHLDALSKYSIPTKYLQRYVEKVIFPVLETAEDDDVQHLALFSLAKFYRFSTLDDALKLRIATAVVDFTCDLPPPPAAKATGPVNGSAMLHSSNLDENRIFYKRYVRAVTDRNTFTFTPTPTKLQPEQDKQWLTNYVRSLECVCETLAKCDDRKTRLIIIKMIEYNLSALPVPGSRFEKYPVSLLPVLLAPFKKLDGMFYEAILGREMSQQTSLEVLDRIPELLAYLAINPESVAMVKKAVTGKLSENSYFDKIFSMKWSFALEDLDLFGRGFVLDVIQQAARSYYGTIYLKNKLPLLFEWVELFVLRGEESHTLDVAKTISFAWDPIRAVMGSFSRDDDAGCTTIVRELVNLYLQFGAEDASLRVLCYRKFVLNALSSYGKYFDSSQLTNLFDHFAQRHRSLGEFVERVVTTAKQNSTLTATNFLDFLAQHPSLARLRSSPVSESVVDSTSPDASAPKAHGDDSFPSIAPTTYDHRAEDVVVMKHAIAFLTSLRSQNTSSQAGMQQAKFTIDLVRADIPELREDLRRLCKLVFNSHASSFYLRFLDEFLAVHNSDSLPLDSETRKNMYYMTKQILFSSNSELLTKYVESETLVKTKLRPVLHAYLQCSLRFDPEALGGELQGALKKIVSSYSTLIRRKSTVEIAQRISHIIEPIVAFSLNGDPDYEVFSQAPSDSSASKAPASASPAASPRTKKSLLKKVMTYFFGKPTLKTGAVNSRGATGVSDSQSVAYSLALVNLAVSLLSEHYLFFVLKPELSLAFMHVVYAQSVATGNPAIHVKMMDAMIRAYKSTLLSSLSLYSAPTLEKKMHESAAASFTNILEGLLSLEYMNLRIHGYMMPYELSRDQYQAFGGRLGFSLLKTIAVALPEYRDGSQVWKDEYVSLLEQFSKHPCSKVKKEALEVITDIKLEQAMKSIFA